MPVADSSAVSAAHYARLQARRGGAGRLCSTLFLPPPENAGSRAAVRQGEIKREFLQLPQLVESIERAAAGDMKVLRKLGQVVRVQDPPHAHRAAGSGTALTPPPLQATCVAWTRAAQGHNYRRV